MYKALVHFDVPIINNKQLWKMNVPLKIKIFTWYLQRGVVTKDNLTKRNWQGSIKCCFYHHNESIKPLFFECQFVHSMVRHPSAFESVSTQLFCQYFGQLAVMDRKHIYVGAIALLWSLWPCKNDIVF